MQTLWQILLFILLLYIGACVAYGAYKSLKDKINPPRKRTRSIFGSSRGKLTRRQKQLNQTFEDMLEGNNKHSSKRMLHKLNRKMKDQTLPPSMYRVTRRATKKSNKPSKK